MLLVEELIKLTPLPADTKELMTMQDLEKCNGKNGSKAYIACKGIVYDCSKNEVYVGEGGYNCFAGTDATVALGTMEFKNCDKTDWRTVLNQEALTILNDWVKWYNERYTVIGYLEKDLEYYTKNDLKAC